MNQAAAVGSAVTIPVVWSFLGFDFQAGPVIVGVCAVVITRLIVTLNSKTRPKLVLDVAVSTLCALLTALWVQAHTLSLLPAGITGIGIASIGLGIIGLANSQILGPLRAGWLAALKASATAATPPAGPHPREDDRAAIDDAMATLNTLPKGSSDGRQP